MNGVARFDGAFSALTGALGTGVDGSVQAFAELGGDLYLGGTFSSAGGSAATRIVRWDQTDFSALVPTMLDGTVEGVRGDVLALHVFDDGTGEALYIGTRPFEGTDGVDIGALGRWDGTGFEALGIPSGSGPPDEVAALIGFTAPMPGSAFSSACLLGKCR